MERKDLERFNELFNDYLTKYNESLNPKQMIAKITYVYEENKFPIPKNLERVVEEFYTSEVKRKSIKKLQVVKEDFKIWVNNADNKELERNNSEFEIRGNNSPDFQYETVQVIKKLCSEASSFVSGRRLEEFYTMLNSTVKNVNIMTEANMRRFDLDFVKQANLLLEDIKMEARRNFGKSPEEIKSEFDFGNENRLRGIETPQPSEFDFDKAPVMEQPSEFNFDNSSRLASFNMNTEPSEYKSEFEFSDIEKPRTK